MTAKRVFVRELSKSVPTSMALSAFSLGKSSFFYVESSVEKNQKTKPLDPQLSQRLLELSDFELTLGYRKIAAYLSTNFGLIYNKKRVYRHMKKLKLLQPRVFKRHRKSAKSAEIKFYSAIKSNVRWEADLTVVSHSDGQLYLFSVMDTYDKEVIGHWIGFRCRSDEAIQALKQAVLARFPSGSVPQALEVILRLDRGCQFTSKDFGDAARTLGVRTEFCDVQAPNQKPFIESFFSNYKREEVYRNDYQNATQACLNWSRYVDWYNTSRPPASLGFRSPIQFRSKNDTHSLIAA